MSSTSQIAEASREVFSSIPIVLFIISAVSKWIWHKDFKTGLLYIPHVGLRLAGFVGFVLPIVELITAAGLMLSMRWSVWVSIGLLFGFSLLAVAVWARNLRVPCNCFGQDADALLSYNTAIRNFVLIVFVLLRRPPNNSLESFYGVTLAATLVILWTGGVHFIKVCRLTTL